MFYSKIGKLFHANKPLPMNDNECVEIDLWKANKKISSQIDYPSIFNKNPIEDLIVQFADFKDKSSIELLTKQKYVYRSVFEVPESKRDTTYHSVPKHFNSLPLEAADDNKQSDNVKHDKQKSKKRTKHKKKYFKIQLYDMDKPKSIQFDLHPMVEEFMKRTIDKLTVKAPKEKQYKKKAKKGTDSEEDEMEEKLRIMQVLKNLQQEEREEKRRNTELAAASNSTPIDLEVSPTLSTPEQHPSVQQSPTIDSPSTVVDFQEESAGQRKLSVYQPGPQISSINVPTINLQDQVQEKQLSVLSETLRQPEIMAPKRLSTHKPDQISVMYDSNNDKAITHDLYGENAKDVYKKTSDSAFLKTEPPQDVKITETVEKATSSGDLMKRDAATGTEQRLYSGKSRMRNVHVSFDKQNDKPPSSALNKNKSAVYNRNVGAHRKQISKTETNNSLQVAKLGKKSKLPPDFNRGKRKPPSKNVLYFTYKSPLFEIQFQEFSQNELEEQKKRLNRGSGDGDYWSAGENFISASKIKEANNLLCYNESEYSISKKKSRVSSIKKSQIIRTLAATCAYPSSIQSTKIEVKKSYSKVNKCYFNKNTLLLNSEQINYCPKDDKNIVNHYVNGINPKNEIAKTLQRIDSLQSVSDHLGNFLKTTSSTEEDVRKINTIISSYYQDGVENHSICNCNNNNNNGKRISFSNNSQPTVLPVYIDLVNSNFSIINKDYGSVVTSESNSNSSKTELKTSRIPERNKRVYLENFKSEPKKLLHKETMKIQQSSSPWIDCTDDGDAVVKKCLPSMKSSGSISQSEIGNNIVGSMFLRRDCSVEEDIDYDLGKKIETCNLKTSEETFEIINISERNALKETKYLLSSNNSVISNQSAIKLNVHCQNVNAREINSYTNRYPNNLVLPNYLKNLPINDEIIRENFVKNEIKTSNTRKPIEESYRSNQTSTTSSIHSITTSNRTGSCFRHNKETVHIPQEKRICEAILKENQRKSNSTEIYETRSREEILSVSNRTSEQPFNGTLSNTTILSNKMKSYFDKIYSSKCRHKSSKSKDNILENNQFNNECCKHEEVYSANIDPNSNNNIVKYILEDIPLNSIKICDRYSTGNSTSKLQSTSSVTSTAENSNFPNYTEYTKPTTILFCINNERHFKEMNANITTVNNEQDVKSKSDNKQLLKQFNTRKLSGSTDETSSKHSTDHDYNNRNDITNNRSYYFIPEINKANFKQTDGVSKSMASDEINEKSVKNSISVVYM